MRTMTLYIPRLQNYCSDWRMDNKESKKEKDEKTEESCWEKGETNENSN